MARKPGRALLLTAVVFLALLGLALRAQGVSASAAPQRVHVTAGQPYEFSFIFSTNVVRRGKVLFSVRNKGRLRHRLEVCLMPGSLSVNACIGTETRWILPGSTAMLSVVFKKPGAYQYLCPVRGHAAAGMKGALIVH